MTGLWKLPRQLTRPAHLVAVNAALVLLLAVITLASNGSSRANAQTGGSPVARPRGHYTVLSPKSATSDTGTLVIVDSINEQMTSLDWDKTRQSLVVRGYSDLSTDSAEVIGR